MPILFEGVPAVNAVPAGNPSRNVILSGVDPTRLDPFGGLISVDGQRIDLAAIPAGSVVLSEKAAEKLDAKSGDSLMLYYANQPLTLDRRRDRRGLDRQRRRSAAAGSAW